MTAGDVDSGYSAARGQGWLFFAGTILGLAGIMRILDGIWALRYNGAVPENLQDALLGHSIDTYGWVWIGVGVVLILASFGILTGSQISRWIGFIAAGLLA